MSASYDLEFILPGVNSISKSLALAIVSIKYSLKIFVVERDELRSSLMSFR